MTAPLPVSSNSLRTSPNRCGPKRFFNKREKQLSDIVANASETICTFSPEGIFTFVSPAWTENLGHDPAEVLGHSFTEFIHPEDLSQCTALLERVRTVGNPRESVEYRIRHKDGTCAGTGRPAR